MKKYLSIAFIILALVFHLHSSLKADFAVEECTVNALFSMGSYEGDIHYVMVECNGDSSKHVINNRSQFEVGQKVDVVKQSGPSGDVYRLRLDN